MCPSILYYYLSETHHITDMWTIKFYTYKTMDRVSEIGIFLNGGLEDARTWSEWWKRVHGFAQLGAEILPN
jgi:hypothetical protein